MMQTREGHCIAMDINSLHNCVLAKISGSLILCFSANMLNWVLSNPIKSSCAFGIVGSPFIDSYLRRRAKRELQFPVYQRLLSGSKPDLQHSTKAIPRPQVEKDMTTKFLPKPEDTFTDFCFIIGPSGSGKTHAVRELCNKYPNGVLYYEITNPHALVAGISKEIGMKTSHSVLDEVLSCISKDYCCYHILPWNKTDGIEKVLKVLEHSAIEYKEKHGEIPVLFIDGIDKLVKHDEELLATLVRYTNELMNNKTIKIVLVSSENTIVPYIMKTGYSMRALIYEVDDIGEDETTLYLMQNGFSQDEAKKLFGCMGGRLEYLQGLRKLSSTILNSGDICGNATKALFPLLHFQMYNQQLCITSGKPDSMLIIRKLVQGGSASLTDLFKDAKDNKRMVGVIEDMIDAKIIRYDTKGDITWFSRVQERELSKLVK